MVEIILVANLLMIKLLFTPFHKKAYYKILLKNVVSL